MFITDGSTGDKAREGWEKSHQHKKEMAKESKRSHNHSRHKRSLSLERYVETMIVVDSKMYEYYKDDDLENYVLTIMNMVSDQWYYSLAWKIDIFILDNAQEEL